MINSKTISSEIELIEKLIFQPCGFELKNATVEKESKEYHAHTFLLNKHIVKFRTAKITPTKVGQFVTIWKRNTAGITEPFNVLDNIDFYMIATRTETNFGVFVFPKSVLHEHKILSDNTRDGKRGIRVYPPWDLTTNIQAQKTQRWQINYFLSLTHVNKIDLTRAKQLLCIEN